MLTLHLFQFLPACDNQRSAKRKFELRFRRDIQFLAFGQHLNRGSTTRAYTGADSGSFLATRNRANDRANSSAAAGALGCLRTAAFADFVVLGRSDWIPNAIYGDLRQFKSQLGGTGDSASLVNIGDAPANVCSAWNHFDSTLIEGLIEHRSECFADFVGFAVDAVNHANQNLGTGRNRIACIGCVRRRWTRYALAARNQPRIRSGC